jgi:hypothetical protein
MANPHTLFNGGSFIAKNGITRCGRGMPKFLELYNGLYVLGNESPINKQKELF